MLVLLILGILIMGAFVVWEMKYPYAMIDMKIWKDRDFSLVRCGSAPSLMPKTDAVSC